ncbi:MAG: hypothetical protein R3C11_18140 [Planctomycetaceae bacterium]
MATALLWSGGAWTALPQESATAQTDSPPATPASQQLLNNPLPKAQSTSPASQPQSENGISSKSTSPQTGTPGGIDNSSSAKNQNNAVVPYRNTLFDENENRIPLNDELSRIIREFLKNNQQSSSSESQGKLLPVARIPDASITSINVEGKVQDEIAKLDITYKVQVNSDVGPYSVPLGAKEGILVDIAYQGPGQQVQDRFEPKVGYYWWFSGKGMHELKLSMDVMIEQLDAFPNLNLSLPADAAIRKAKIQLPNLNLELSLPVGTPLTQRELETGQTEATFPIRGKSLNLSWKFIPPVKDKQVVLKSDTSIHLIFVHDSLEKSVQMKVQQTVRPDEQGSFKSLCVQLPQNFDLTPLKQEMISSYELKKDQLKVTLKEAATGPVTLEYELELRSLESDEVSLDGAFELLNDGKSSFETDISTQTLEQTGKITIQKGESFLIRSISQESDLIRPESIKSIEPGLPVSQAFRFFQQPFRLKLKVEEIPPLSSVDAHYQLSLTPNLMEAGKLNAKLNANLDIQIFRGELNDLSLNWKQFADEGWSEPSFRQFNLIDKISFDKETQEMKISFIQPVSEDTNLTFETEKTISADAPAIDFSLPLFSKDMQRRQRRTILSVISPSNLQTQLTTSNSISALPLSNEEENRYAIPQTSAEENILQRALISENDYNLHLDLKKLSREINARTKIELQENLQQSMRISQEIELDVKYDPLKQIRLLIPEGLKNSSLIIRDTDRKEITPEKSEVAGGASELLIPPSKGLGTFSIYVEYSTDSISRSSQDGQAFQIPIFVLDSNTFEKVELSTNQKNRYKVIIDSQNWNPIVLENKTTWQLDSKLPPEAEVSFRILPIKQHVVQDFEVPLALYKIDLRAQESKRIDARYLIDGSPGQIQVTMPDNYSKSNISWDGVSLTELPEPGTREWLLEVPENKSKTRHILSISYALTPRGNANWLRSYRIELPQLSREIWTPSIAEVICPNGQHLLSPPSLWAPLYSWQREGIFWYRRSNLSRQSNELYQELQGSDPIVSRYQYDFARTDSGDSLSLQTISLAMLVFTGAGSALLCGFLFRRFKLFHNSFAFCVLLFLIALAGLWYWAVIQVFIQPALIGGLFALVAIIIEVMLQRRHETEFYEPGSSIALVLRSGIRSQQIGSEDSTAVRVPSNHQVSVSSSTAETEESP